MTDVLTGSVELLKLSWRQSRVKLVAAILLKLGGAAALPLSAPALSMLTNAAVAHEPFRATVAAVIVASLTIAALTLGHFAHVLYFELGEINALKKDRRLVQLVNGSPGLEHLELPAYADKIQVLQQEMRRLSSSSMEALLSTMSVAVAVVVTSVLLALLNPLLLLLPLAAVPPVLLGRRAGDRQSRARDRVARWNRHARHLFELTIDSGAAKELRVSGVGDELRARHAHAWRQATRVIQRAEVRAAALLMAGQVVFAVGYVAATLLVVRDVVRGNHGVGDVVYVISLAALVNNQVSSAVTLLQELQRATRALADVRWVERLVAPSEPGTPDRALPPRLSEGIRFRNVGFAYPGMGHKVLRDVNLLLPAGCTVAIVGENGAGKSTLVKLLCRFYEPTQGCIELDGVDLRRFPVEAWRGQIAAGFQDFARFEFVARESVGVGDLPRIDSDTAVVAALERAGSQDVLSVLDRGLDTILGKSYADGVELSGGQWQKLALGRAMMPERPLLLVLDEPTAALDAESEYLLFHQYARNAKRVARDTGGITVLVSHRFSTVRMADMILVVNQGRVDIGDHDTLMAQGGLYAQLFEIQERAYR